jgi:hypothetical protein
MNSLFPLGRVANLRLQLRPSGLLNTSPSHRSNRVRATPTTMPFSPLALVPGTRIGVYDITTQIGADGMGEGR